jgi:glutamate-1-semialdehyde 2,1-aminomutase
MSARSSGVRLWEEAKRVIPGGNQLLSKRAEMFLPGQWPAYYSKARGAHVWDLDGRRYVDMSIMGIGTCVLGYADPGVTKAVTRAVRDGNMSTLNCPEEVELAKTLVALHPWSDMARFARSGGEACSIAVRIARAASGRDGVLFCGYHGWGDWYLAANLAHSKNLDGQLLPGLEPKGVPRALEGTATPFAYGDVAGFRAKLKTGVGVVIMEVQRHKEIDARFLKELARLTRRSGAVLVYDEVTSGFRQRPGGMHTLHGLEPDIVVLGKAMGNGHPIAAVVGRRKVMQAAQRTFISSTYWTERTGYAAALEVIRRFEKEPVARQLTETGARLRRGLADVCARAGVDADVAGLPAVPILQLKGDDAALAKTLFIQEMLAKGYLASNVIYASLAHTRGMVDAYLSATERAFAAVADARKKGDLRRRLKGPACHTGFRRLA